MSKKKTDDVWLGLHNRKITISQVNTTPIKFDHQDLLTKSLKEISPDLIVHTAGMTSVENCQKNPEAAFRVNSEYTGLISRLAFSENIKMIHISTDQLFKGNRSFMKESDLPEPINVYGLSKLAGENIVRVENPKALILRVNFFGWGPKYRHSFSDWILSSITQGKRITLYDNVIFNPLNVTETINCAHNLLSIGAEGLYNLTNNEAVSKYEFGLRLADQFGINRDFIKCGYYNSDNKVPRPLNMSLDNSKFLRDCVSVDFSIEESIAKLKKDHNRKKLLHSIDQ